MKQKILLLIIIFLISVPSFSSAEDSNIQTENSITTTVETNNAEPTG